MRQSAGLKESGGPNAYRYITKIALGWNLPPDDAWWQSIIAKAAHLVEGMSQKVVDRLEDFPYGISEYSSGDKIVPELIQDAFTPEAVAREAISMLTDRERAARHRILLSRHWPRTNWFPLHHPFFGFHVIGGKWVRLRKAMK